MAPMCDRRRAYDSADEPIGIYIYGYGEANSYGYVGGTGCQSIDFNPPNIIAADECFPG